MKIGVVYCATEVAPTGRELEKLADLEILEVAAAIQMALEERGHQVERVSLDPNRLEEILHFDWIFNLAETIYGYPLKEYEITETIEQMGLPFTGSGSKTLKTCTDKSLTKERLREWGILTPGSTLYQPGEKILARHRFPLIVKPVNEDGSIGIAKDSVVYSLEALTEKVLNIHENYRQAAIAEEYIDGRDISVPILGNQDRLEILPLMECVFRSSFVGPRIQTFEAKWVEDSADYQNCYTACPCQLEASLFDKIKETCIRAYNLLGCRDYARIDLRLRDRNPYIIEVNPNPCINPHDSGFVRAADAAGYHFDQLIDTIIKHSQYNWSRSIPSLRGMIYGNLFEKTYPDRPTGDYQFAISG